VFVVRLRDDTGSPWPGVRIADNGPKQGLLGVDNGQFWLNNVRVPRDALLDRFSQVGGLWAWFVPLLFWCFGWGAGGGGGGAASCGMAPQRVGIGRAAGPPASWAGAGPTLSSQLCPRSTLAA
jgi:alkylation response protein AidB-like acyl-CoA dehydrogenase